MEFLPTDAEECKKIVNGSIRFIYDTMATVFPPKHTIPYVPTYGFPASLAEGFRPASLL